jgi:hypothetical protein
LPTNDTRTKKQARLEFHQGCLFVDLDASRICDAIVFDIDLLVPIVAARTESENGEQDGNPEDTHLGTLQRFLHCTITSHKQSAHGGSMVQNAAV